MNYLCKVLGDPERKDNEVYQSLKSTMSQYIGQPNSMVITPSDFQCIIKLLLDDVPYSVKGLACNALGLFCHDNQLIKSHLIKSNVVTAILTVLTDDQHIRLGRPSQEVWGTFLKLQATAAGLLQKLSYYNILEKLEMSVPQFIIKLLKLCDLNKLRICDADSMAVLQNLLKTNTLVGQVTDMKTTRKEQICRSYLQKDNLDGVLLPNKSYIIELYDTSNPDIDIHINSKLVELDIVCKEYASDRVDLSKDGSSNTSGEWHDVLVTCIIDAGHVMCHIDGNHELAMSVSQKLHDYCAHTWKPLKRAPTVGCFVVAYIDADSGREDRYYRGQAIKTPENKQVMFYSLDYGFITRLPWTQMCLLTSDMNLTGIPPLATLCKLKDIVAKCNNIPVTETALKCLCNISTGTGSWFVAEYIDSNGGTDVLFKLAVYPLPRVSMVTLQVIVNLTLCPKVRKSLIDQGAFNLMLDICDKYSDRLTTDEESEVFSTCLAVLSNLLCNNTPLRNKFMDLDGMNMLLNVCCETKSQMVQLHGQKLIRILAGNTDISNITQLLNRSNQESRRSSFSADSRSPRRSSSGDRDGIMRSVERRLVASEIESGNSGSRDTKGVAVVSGDEGDGEPLITRHTDGNIVPVEAGEAYTLSVYGTRFRRGCTVQGYMNDDSHELRAPATIPSKAFIAKILCGFLNSVPVGNLYLGINGKDGFVSGLNIDRESRDELRLGIDSMMNDFSPQVVHTQFDVKFFPVLRMEKDAPIPDLFVAEIIVKSTCQDLYEIRIDNEWKSFCRRNCETYEMTNQDIREKVSEIEQERCNTEIDHLRYEINKLMVTES